MKEYITTANIRLAAGLIGLTVKQATRRPGCLGAVKGKKGVFEIVRPVEFKAGETILIDPDKMTLASLELTPKGIEMEKAEKKAAEKAAAEKKKAEKEKAEKAEKEKAAAAQAIDDGDVTGSGAPEVAAMVKILGYEITAAERNTAWKAL